MKNALLSISAYGFLWLVLLFALCFLIVHTVRLAQLGRKYQLQNKDKDNKPQSEEKKPTQEKKAPPQNEGEPVYYIVERKRRTKSSYSEPKRIHFK